mgnify:CR=1 FL=1
MGLLRPALAARYGRDHPTLGGLHPVGRLDADTGGLILLTNDGDFTFRLTHPRHEVVKTYEALVGGVPTDEALRALREGIPLDGRMTAPAEVRVLRTDRRRGRALVSVSIHEGRKRQVRRMLGAVGLPVIELRRVRIGPLALGRLKPGEWRELRDEEVAALLAAAAGEPIRPAPLDRARRRRPPSRRQRGPTG